MTIENIYMPKVNPFVPVGSKHGKLSQAKSKLQTRRGKNPNLCSVYGVGYLGVGDYYSKVCGIHTKEYVLWKNMLYRCYSEKALTTDPSYKSCRVHKRWLNFQNFAADINEIIGFKNKDWQLDKDILLQGNTVYSRKRCCFVPQEINKLLNSNASNRGTLPMGVTRSRKKFQARLKLDSVKTHIGIYDTPTEAYEAYIKQKQKYIRRVAKRFKKELEPKVYKALLLIVITKYR